MKITQNYLKKMINESIKEARYEYSRNDGLSTDIDDLRYLLNAAADQMENSEADLSEVATLIYRVFNKVTGQSVDPYELPSYSRREY